MSLNYPSKITIKDVARESGVSTQTISRVLNNRLDVSPATREKVLAVINDLGYQPNALARSMRQSTKTLGVIVAGLHFFGISDTLNGITQASEARGLSLMLKELASFNSIDIEPLIQSLTAHQVQGIIYAAPEVSDNWKTILKNHHNHLPPMVFLKGNSSSAPVTISLDNYTGAYTLTRHLIEQGYRHIAHLCGPLDWWESRERRRGWMSALQDAGLAVPETADIAGNWTSTSGAVCFEVLLRQYPEMDAIFVSNDQMALGVLNLAWEKGIKVPQQLGVAGFDDIPESRYFIPPLTTIHQDLKKLGELAVRKLIAMHNPEIDDSEVTGNTIILPTELRVRRSTQR